MAAPCLDEQTEILTDTDADNPPACEAQDHSKGLWGHVPDEPAEFIVFGPCGASYACCRGRVEAYARRRYIAVNCDSRNGCGSAHWGWEFTWTELP